jgi:serine/threonine-protein kinase
MGNYQKGHLLQGGKYIVEQQIGRGGFGLTYLARNNETYLPTDRLQEIFPLMGSVVIKIPNENLQNNPKFGKYKQKFLEEAEKLKRFSHPNIVRFIDSFEEANLPHIVMEHIQGKSLKHWRLEEATSGNSATIIEA